MSDPTTTDPKPVKLQEVRYSLRSMLDEVRNERKSSALGRELIDHTEIEKMFSNRKRIKKKS
ncbi:hypothetical protein [Coraliomargarita parva]|uniref:hypothetical protein n=1 Tax=Coraliomargarita parva TaxID=3014050 RepID=UPI0022B453B7|nr:hypothetical protein [Coraliomargarita parva]